MYFSFLIMFKKIWIYASDSADSRVLSRWGHQAVCVLCSDWYKGVSLLDLTSIFFFNRTQFGNMSCVALNGWTHFQDYTVEGFKTAIVLLYRRLTRRKNGQQQVHRHPSGVISSSEVLFSVWSPFFLLFRNLDSWE